DELRALGVCHRQQSDGGAVLRHPGAADQVHPVSSDRGDVRAGGDSPHLAARVHPALDRPGVGARSGDHRGSGRGFDPWGIGEHIGRGDRRVRDGAGDLRVGAAQRAGDRDVDRHRGDADHRYRHADHHRPHPDAAGAPMKHVGVIDIGKTNAKFAVVDTEAMAEMAVRTRPNRVLDGPPYPHFDIEGIWEFLLEAMEELNREHRIDALSITTHGATAALVDAAGELVLPVLDYECDGPDAVREDYDALCPPFPVTLTPKLGMGLNLGAQLYWLKHRWPDEFARTRTI